MWTITTNESNPATLKLIAALKNVQKTDYKVVINNPADKTCSLQQRLPVVDVDENLRLYSTNAALQLLQSCKSEAEQDEQQLVQQWLEFEACQLAPTVVHAIAGKSAPHKSGLIGLLKTLDGYASQAVTKNILLSDIAIWSTLYPLTTDQTLHKEYLDTFANLTKWLSKVTQEKPIQEAIKEYTVTAGLVALQALSTGAKYPTQSVPAGNSPTIEETTVTSEELEAARKAWSSTEKLPKPNKEVNPVLPVAKEKNILITAALPYVNNVPHLGNIIGCVLSADVFARFSRLCNWNTLFIGGTDEYGTATETKALEEGLTPREICDKYFEIHNNIYRWFNIGFDHFGRTTTPEQTKLVQDVFRTLNGNGFMETQAVEQLLCEKCNRYLADRFVEGGCPHPGCNYEDARGDQCDGCGKLVNAIELLNPRCKVCRSSPVIKTSEQFFLQLNKLEPLLLHWMKTATDGWTNNAKVITRAWMKEGLKPRCITRDLKWGIPVPIDGYREKVFYVWFDAPLGYVSMTERYTKDWKKWWQPEKGTDVALYQFMGKDNVPFHSVMFPGCLLGANQGWVLVKHVMATEYVNYEDGKFSKSRGVGVFGNNAQDTGIPSDVWRFYLLYIRPEVADTCFSWTDLALKVNSELLNNLGNFCNRALVFTEKFYNSMVPEMSPIDDDFYMLALCARELRAYCLALEKCKLRDGIRHILAISKHGNQYMQSTQPWVLLKGTDEEKKRASTVIGVCVNITCLLATLLFPYMPDSSRNLRKQLNAPADNFILTPEASEIVLLLPAGHRIGKPAPLFEKLETARVDELRKRFGGVQEKPQAGNASQLAEIAKLEAAVKEQADKVRILKSNGVEKSKWQPEVAILLDLKKQLEAAQKSAKAATKTLLPQTAVVGEVGDLEKAVQAQGEKVRALKASGVEKAAWQPEVNALLALKKQLEAAQKARSSLNGSNSATEAVDAKGLEAEIEKQGQVVRKMKESGAPKTEWQPQVDDLLALKKKLAMATGQPIAAGKSKGKK